MRKLVSAGLAAIAVLASVASAEAAFTGTPLPANPNWSPNSTNALNEAMQTPGRVGQVAPFVVFNSDGPGSVTLSFNNGANGLAFFEIRLDGIATGATPHPVVSGDTIHTGGIAVNSGVLNQLGTFYANSTVDVRLALGGERDWDFNWVRFEVGQAAVPEPSTLAVWSILGLCGSAAAWRANRKRKIA